MIREEVEKVDLKLRLNLGLVNGKEKFKSKTYSKVKKDSSNEAILNTAEILAELQNHDLESVHRVESLILSR